MVYINEWLPNPIGKDSQGICPAQQFPNCMTGVEWVELGNNGNSPIDLSGWELKTKGGSRAALSGNITPGEYLVFPRAKTKLVLKNTDEGVFLYDAKGALVDQSVFMGSAPEGKSFSLARRSESEGGANSNSFIWANPTPGVKNVSLDMAVAKNEYPIGVPLHNSLSAPEVILMAFGVGIVFMGIAIVVIKRNHDLQKLLFGKN